MSVTGGGTTSSSTVALGAPFLGSFKGAGEGTAGGSTGPDLSISRGMGDPSFAAETSGSVGFAGDGRHRSGGRVLLIIIGGGGCRKLASHVPPKEMANEPESAAINIHSLLVSRPLCSLRDSIARNSEGGMAVP